MTPQQQADDILAKVGNVLCGWCLPKITVLKAGDPLLPTSHGICRPCREQAEREDGQ